MKKTNNKKGPSSYCLPHIKRTRIPIYLLFKIKLKGKYRPIDLFVKIVLKHIKKFLIREGMGFVVKYSC